MTETAPEPHTVAVTPSGVEIAYYLEPRRFYQVRRGKGRWKEAVSVTTALDCLNKEGLPWWGMKVGIEGLLTLFNIGLIKPVKFGEVDVLAYEDQDEEGRRGLYAAGVDKIVDLLGAAKLTVNHVRDKAGDRGQAVHDALELWAAHWSPLGADLPDPDFFPPAEAGYVKGLLDFLTATKAEPIASEVMVGSVKHGYAGRYDLRMRVPEDCEVVVHRTPVKGPQYRLLKAGVYLVDLKTSKSVYASHARQLEAYETASIECGYEPTDGRGVIHVTAEGHYCFVPSWATFKDFQVVLQVHKSDEAMKAKKREMK